MELELNADDVRHVLESHNGEEIAPAFVRRLCRDWLKLRGSSFMSATFSGAICELPKVSICYFTAPPNPASAEPPPAHTPRTAGSEP